MIFVSRRFCGFKQINTDQKRSAESVKSARKYLATDCGINMIFVSRRFGRFKQINTD